MSIDAIMYFLALLKKIKSSSTLYGFRGSYPANRKCRELLQASGFFRYVDAGRTQRDLNYESTVVQIQNGEHVETEIAKQVCDFTIDKLRLKRTDTKQLYDMVIELMSNTRQHAYRHKKSSYNEWYIFVQFLPEERTVRFIFLDTGEGIPATVKRKGFEVAREFVGLGPRDTQFIRSALEGQFRSRTGDTYRGKGLPRVNRYCVERYINDLTIISNRGYFGRNQNGDMARVLDGTLFYWEIAKESVCA